MKELTTLVFLLVARTLYAPSPESVFEDIVSDAVEVTATVYSAVRSQTNEDPFHTAFMYCIDSLNPFKHKIVAVSRDLLTQFPNGTQVLVEGTDYDGVYTVQDKMNKRYTNRIDILVNEDMPIGRWDSVKLRRIN